MTRTKKVAEPNIVEVYTIPYDGSSSRASSASRRPGPHPVFGDLSRKQALNTTACDRSNNTVWLHGLLQDADERLRDLDGLVEEVCGILEVKGFEDVPDALNTVVRERDAGVDAVNERVAECDDLREKNERLQKRTSEAELEFDKQERDRLRLEHELARARLAAHTAEAALAEGEAEYNEVSALAVAFVALVREPTIDLNNASDATKAVVKTALQALSTLGQ